MGGSEKVVGQGKGNTALYRAARGFRRDSYDLAEPYNTVRAALYGTGRTLLYGARKKPSRPVSWRVPRGLIAAATGIGLLLFTGWFCRLRITLTDSAAPAGIYRVSEVPAERGALVAACLPPAIARQGLARGYLQRGDCPTGAEPVAKVIGALAGDELQIEPGFVAVNGMKFPNSSTAAHDSAGRPLTHVPSGARRVRDGEVWLFGFRNSRSWDARYFGPVPAANVRGVLKPVVTW
jgi:conjugative transfer signal peptidase TraF